MSKVLQRDLFRGKAPRTTAHGTGITTYFMDDRPGFADGELVDYNKLMQDYLSRPTAEMPEAPASDFNTLFKNYSEVVGKSLGPERTYDDLLKERMRILGPNVDSESARNYALMQLGSKIASTPGGLGLGIAAGLPEYASTMSKAESERRALERSAGASALDALDKERALRRGAETEAAKYAFTESEAAKKSAYTSAVEAAKASEERKFKALQDLAKYQNEQRDKYGVLGTESFALEDPTSPGGYKIIGARRTPQGLVQVGNGQPVPQNAIPVGDSFISELKKQGQAKEATNISIQNPDGTFSKPQAAIQKGEKFYDAATGTLVDRPFRIMDKSGTAGSGTSSSYVIQDPNSPFGLKEVIGFTDPVSQQNYYMHNGVRFDFDSSKGIKASLADVLKSDTKDGETTTTPSFGPYAGKPFTVSSSKRNVQFEPPVPIKDPALAGGESAPSKGEEPSKKSENAPVGAITGEGPERYFIKPEPFKSSLSYSQLSAQDKQDLRDSIQGGEKFLADAQDVLKAMPESLGPISKVKSLTTNYIGPITPKAIEPYVTFLKTEDGKQQLRMMRQTAQLAFAKNPRFPQGELKTIDEMIENPDAFFADPKAGMTRYAALVREVRNSLERDRAMMEGRDAKVIERVPSGTQNDPFSFDKTPYLVELKKSGVNLKGVYYRDQEGNLRQIP